VADAASHGHAPSRIRRLDSFAGRAPRLRGSAKDALLAQPAPQYRDLPDVVSGGVEREKQGFADCLAGPGANRPSCRVVVLAFLSEFFQFWARAACNPRPGADGTQSTVSRGSPLPLPRARV